MEHIRPYGFPVVEYYCENCSAEQIQRLMGDHRSVFLAAALQKSKGLNPSSRVPEDRKKAVDALTECFLFARQAGAESVLINSGPRPEKMEYDSECLKILRESICELNHRAGRIPIVLEPGDRNVEYRHLIGPTDMAVSFIEDLQSEVPGISLVFDISHIAQLNENLYSSWNVAKKYCHHLHLANCILDRSSPLYGDKHPLFSVPNGVYSHEDARAFFLHLQNEGQPLTIGIEMICRETDEAIFFKRFSEETAWFFSM